ncbi:MAG TPA: GNAT family N-acetyltransferase [Kofleriaceae bacterium]
MTLDDLELFRIQFEDVLDGRRMIGAYGVAIVCTADRDELWISTEVADEQAAELTAVFDGAARATGALEPPALERCRPILERDGRALVTSGGPSYVFPDDTRFASDVRVERSDAPTAEALRDANPGNWHPVEWNELLDGQLGPWAAATEGERVVSLCHTPRPLTPRGAECGVWTRPGHRGRGYAAAVTAAWAALVRPSGRHLFYCTGVANRSSQRVTERLGLRRIGWIWRLELPRPPDDAQLHPLSALRRAQ